jgi:drug/metabolite transporter (DMT)-like permease
VAALFALGASLSWGVGDFLGGRAARVMHVLTVVAVSQMVGLAAVLCWAMLSSDRFPPAPDLGPAAAAGVGGAVGLAALYRGMAVGAMGVVAPISALAPLIPLAVGLATGERPSAVQLLGTALALAGVAVLSREPGGRRGRAAGTGLAVVAAAGFGSYLVLLDAAADTSVPWAVTVARATSAALALAATVRVSASLRVPRLLLPTLIAIGLADVGANVLFGLASTRGLLAVASVLASLYPVVTVALARIVLGERLAASQRLGGSGAMAGAALVAAG